MTDQDTNDGNRIVLEYDDSSDRWTATTEVLKVTDHGVESIWVSKTGLSPFSTLAFLEDALAEE